MLETLQKIESEVRLDRDQSVRVSYLLARLYEDHFRARWEAEVAAAGARLKEEAQSEDPEVRRDAEASLGLRKMGDRAKVNSDYALLEWLMAGGKRNKRGDAADLEHQLNPSRIFAQLERRGLVERCWGGVRLTEAGRNWK
jgi:hypothetical protein